MFRLSRLTGRKIDRLNKKLRDVNLYLHRFFYSICNSFADFSGKPSSNNDIQLMVYSIREKIFIKSLFFSVRLYFSKK